MLTQEIRDFVRGQKLGYVATVSPDGRPNLSPKGTIITWNDSLAFADIRSPNTISNVLKNPNVEINIIDPLSRKGYLFEGIGGMAGDDDLKKITSVYREMGIKSEIRGIVIVTVTEITAVTSPLYDLGMTEEEIRASWKERLGL